MDKMTTILLVCLQGEAAVLETIFCGALFEQKPFHMQIDTGSSITLISEAMYQKSLGDVPLQTLTVKLHTYTGEEVPVLGNIVWMSTTSNKLIRKLKH